MTTFTSEDRIAAQEAEQKPCVIVDSGASAPEIKISCPNCKREYHYPTEQTACIQLHGSCVVCNLHNETLDLKQVQDLAILQRGIEK